MISESINSQISNGLVKIWGIISLITYFLGLFKLLKDDEYDEFFAAKVSVFVKFPQILPSFLMGVISLGLIIVPPIGIFVSFILWIYIITVYITTSIVVAIACIKIKKAGRLSTVSAVTLGILSFMPIMEYIVPLFLLVKVGNKKRIEN